MGRANRSHNAPTSELLEKERQCLELRRAGATFEDIAVRLRYTNRSAAYKAYRRAIARTLQQPADEIRTLEQDRLDKLLTAVWSAAMRGNLGAVDRALRISERRSRLLGLDFADGLAARQVALAEEQGALLASGLGWLVQRMTYRLSLAEDQVEIANQLVALMLQALAEGRPPTAELEAAAGPAQAAS